MSWDWSLGLTEDPVCEVSGARRRLFLQSGCFRGTVLVRQREVCVLGQCWFGARAEPRLQKELCTFYVQVGGVFGGAGQDPLLGVTVRSQHEREARPGPPGLRACPPRCKHSGSSGARPCGLRSPVVWPFDVLFGNHALRFYSGYVSVSEMCCFFGFKSKLYCLRRSCDFGVPLWPAASLRAPLVPSPRCS